MKIDFSQAINGLDSKPFKSDDGTDLRLSTVAVAALLGVHAEDQAISGEEKYQRYALSRKVYNASTVEVTAEEIVKLKKLISRQFAPAVVGPAFDLLESKASITPIKAKA